ncbi:hypothetical protein [Comamonas koreensis]|uniref:hypothetical protein n=1 Tax=Comamonas koreensis TaxID=160825 RepID=UPI0015FCF0BC|nr:hypothetical protein [Comamonas koreensis]
MQFVNIHGRPVSTEATQKSPVSKKEAPKSFHKGWKVLGVHPDRVKEAKAVHEAGQKRPSIKGYKPFNQSEWLRQATLKPVQSKPMATPEGAGQLADLARSSGWLNVVVQEVMKGGHK